MNIVKINRIKSKNISFELYKIISLVSSKNKFNLRQGNTYNVPKYLTKNGKK